jgi:hypothetical protein
MPLKVFIDAPKQTAARRVYNTGLDLKRCLRQEAGMYGFWVVKNESTPTALGTCGAGPCQIILMHKAPGWGALGHYAGQIDANKILGGIQKMLTRLRGGPIKSVVLAAGEIGADATQRDYEKDIKTGVAALCPGAFIFWAKAFDGGLLGACYYLPLSEETGLFKSSPGNFEGLGDRDDGFESHNYEVE